MIKKAKNFFVLRGEQAGLGGDFFVPAHSAKFVGI